MPSPFRSCALKWKLNLVLTSQQAAPSVESPCAQLSYAPTPAAPRRALTQANTFRPCALCRHESPSSASLHPHVFGEVARLSFTARIGRALFHRARSASKKDNLVASFLSFRDRAIQAQLGISPALSPSEGSSARIEEPVPMVFPAGAETRKLLGPFRCVPPPSVIPSPVL